MTSHKRSPVYVYYHTPSSRAAAWSRRIQMWLKQHHIPLASTPDSARTLIVLGGDGTILEAVKLFQKHAHLIVGLNLGRVGFLASVRDQKDFLPRLSQFFSGDYTSITRMMLSVHVERKGKTIFSSHALNEAVIQNPLSMSELAVHIEGHPAQFIRGSGLLVATATGSTAFNLSAHGPIVMPDIQCLIVTELLDHNVPTPSAVVNANSHIEVHVKHFRPQGLLANAATSQPLDMVLSLDGGNIFALEKGDIIHVSRSSRRARFVEFEKNYFIKSVQEKFLFR